MHLELESDLGTCMYSALVKGRVHRIISILLTPSCGVGSQAFIFARGCPRHFLGRQFGGVLLSAAICVFVHRVVCMLNVCDKRGIVIRRFRFAPPDY